MEDQKQLLAERTYDAHTVGETPVVLQVGRKLLRRRATAMDFGLTAGQGSR